MKQLFYRGAEMGLLKPTWIVFVGNIFKEKEKLVILTAAEAPRAGFS